MEDQNCRIETQPINHAGAGSLRVLQVMAAAILIGLLLRVMSEKSAAITAAAKSGATIAAQESPNSRP